MFHCPVGVWVIEQHAIISSATVRSPTVYIEQVTLVANNRCAAFSIEYTRI